VKSTWPIITKQCSPRIWMIAHDAACSAHVIRKVWRLLFWRCWPTLEVKNMHHNVVHIDYMCYMPTTDNSFRVLLLSLCIKMSIWSMKSLIPDTSLQTEVCGNSFWFLFPCSDSHSHSQCYSFSFPSNFQMKFISVLWKFPPNS